MEPPQPSRSDGALPHDVEQQERVKAIVARLCREAVRLGGGSRRTAESLAEMGYTGRNGETYRESAVRGWTSGTNPPSAWVFAALVSKYGLSVDEALYGGGLRAELDRLKAGEEQRDAELAGMRRDVQLLAGIVTSHLAGRLDPHHAAEVGRIAGPAPSAG